LAGAAITLLALGTMLLAAGGGEPFAPYLQKVQVQHLAEGVSAPQVVTVTTNVVTVYSNRTGVAYGRVLGRTIQNCGTNAFLYLIGSTNVSATNYHGVVAGGSAVRDGLGSILDLSRVTAPVSMRCESGTTEIAVIELTQ
jgi:hypothetical protein